MRRAVLSSVGWSLITAACVAAQQPAPGQPPPGSEGAVIEAWLECVECRDGELQAVVKLGQPAVARLAPALLDGPPAEKRQSYDKYLRKLYADMKAYEKTHPKSVVPYSEEEFVKRDMAKHEAMYRVRAARALGMIGGPAAGKALDQAATLSLDPYVLSKIKEARAQIK